MNSKIVCRQKLQFCYLLRWSIFLPVFGATVFSGMLYGLIRNQRQAGIDVWQANEILTQGRQLRRLYREGESSPDVRRQILPALRELRQLPTLSREQKRRIDGIEAATVRWAHTGSGPSPRERIRSDFRALLRTEFDRREALILRWDEQTQSHLRISFGIAVLLAGSIILLVRYNLRKLYRLYEEANSKLEASLQSRDEFLSIASHELNTPLTSLQLQLELMQRMLSRQNGNTSQSDRTKKGLMISLSQTQRISGLVSDLLDVSRIRSGRMVYCFDEIDLTALARGVCERETESLNKAGCEVTFEARWPLWVKADSVRLEQVISNLLSNAAKYGARRPVHVRVTTQYAQAVVEVIDHGIGVPEGKENLIFERFERAAGNSIGGLGLGLYISRQIIVSHQGRILVQRNHDGGSTFSLRLPLSHPAQISA